MTDIELGKDAFRYFHNESTKFSSYKYSFAEFYALYGNKADIYADGVGGLIRETSISSSDVRKAMEGLADQAKGRIPKDHQDYMRALGAKAGAINYLDLSVSVAKDVATATIDGAVKVGDSVLTSLSWLTKLLPFLVIGGVIFYIYSFSKNNSTVSKETVDKIKRKAKSVTENVKAKVKKATA